MHRGYVSGARALGYAYSGVGYLAGAGLAAQLGYCFVDHADARGAEGMPHGQQSAVGVHWDVAR